MLLLTHFIYAFAALWLQHMLCIVVIVVLVVTSVCQTSYAQSSKPQPIEEQEDSVQTVTPTARQKSNVPEVTSLLVEDSSLSASTQSATTLAVLGEHSGSNASRTSARFQNWLVVEVIERAEPGGRAIRFSDLLPVVIVDSATQTPIYARSGELIEVGVNRTYYVSIASSGERRFMIEGQPVQIVRTGLPLEDDMVFQREFYIIYEGGPTPAPLVAPPPQTSSSQALQPDERAELERLRRDMMIMRSELDEVKRQKLHRSYMPDTKPLPARGEFPNKPASSVISREGLPSNSLWANAEEYERYDVSSTPAPSVPFSVTPAPVLSVSPATNLYAESGIGCLFRIQFCAVPVEREAERIRSLLSEGGIQNTSVEVYQEPRRNITFYRVRGGCFVNLVQARSALREYTRIAERVRVGAQPMVVTR
jgi:hypothetical protein